MNRLQHAAARPADGGQPDPSQPSVAVKSACPRLLSVGAKLAGATVALISVVTLGVYLTLSAYQRESLLESKEVSALAVVRMFADECVAPIVFEDEGAVSTELQTLAGNQEIEYAAVWIVDLKGRLSRRVGELKRGRVEVVSEVPLAVRLRREPDRVVLVSPVRNARGEIIGATVVAFSLARENRAIASIERTTLIVSSSVAIGFLVLLMAMARLVIVAPLGKLVSAAKELERGGDGEVDIHTRDEVGQLAIAFRSMATAIGLREQRIKSRNRDMQLVMDNVGQGFITLDLAGTMSTERSRVIDDWFGPAGGAVKFWVYLGRIDAAVGEWFELGWTALRDDFMPLSLSLEQLPSLLHKQDRTFELAYRPIMDGEQIDKVIVVISDVTARIERELAEQAQRELMSIFRRTRSDRTALDEFLSETGALIDAITSPPHSDLTLLRRQLHTVKGNAALFGIESVAMFCDRLEDRMKESTDPMSTQDKDTLRTLWAKISHMRAELTDAVSEGGVELDRQEYHAFLDDLRRRIPHDLLAATATSWRFEAASKRLALVVEQIRSLAQRLGRADVEVVCAPTNLRLPPLKWGHFWSAFAHVVRNTVDHGVETAEQRVAVGKFPGATVALSILREAEHVVVSISDDGPGIDWTRIAALAKQGALPHATRADLERALLSDGISSRSEVTSTSGRGVGLSAVRETLRELGGVIEIRTDAGGTTFRFVMPASMLLGDQPSGEAGQPQVGPPSVRVATN